VQIFKSMLAAVERFYKIKIRKSIGTKKSQRSADFLKSDGVELT